MGKFLNSRSSTPPADDSDWHVIKDTVRSKLDRETDKHHSKLMISVNSVGCSVQQLIDIDDADAKTHTITGLPTLMSDLQVVDLHNPAWIASSQEVIHVSALINVNDDDQLEKLIGKEIGVEGKSSTTGKLIAVSEKSISIQTKTVIVVLARTDVTSVHCPHAATTNVTFEFDNLAENAKLALLFQLPATSIEVSAHYTAELDKKQESIALRGQWTITNNTAMTFDKARLFVEEATTQRNARYGKNQYYQQQQQRKSRPNRKKVKSSSTATSSFFGSLGGSSSEEYGSTPQRYGVRFAVPNFVSLAPGQRKTVAFGSQVEKCYVRLVADLCGERNKAAIARGDVTSLTATAAKRVEFKATDCFGAVMPSGSLKFWIAGRPGEPRRPVTIPTTSLPLQATPRWLEITLHMPSNSIVVTRKQLTEPVDDGEEVANRYTRVRYEYSINAAGTAQGVELAIVDPDHVGLTYVDSANASVLRGESTAPDPHGAGRIVAELECAIGAHEHYATRRVIALTFDDPEEEIKLAREAKYELDVSSDVATRDQTDNSDDTNDNDSAAGSKAAPASMSTAASKTKRKAKKVGPSSSSSSTTTRRSKPASSSGGRFSFW